CGLRTCQPGEVAALIRGDSRALEAGPGVLIGARALLPFGHRLQLADLPLALAELGEDVRSLIEQKEQGQQGRDHSDPFEWCISERARRCGRCAHARARGRVFCILEPSRTHARLCNAELRRSDQRAMVADMKRLFRTFVVSTLLLVPAVAVQAQVSVGIRIGEPPAPRAYRVPNRPSPDYVWVEGYQYPQGSHYRWHDGYWTRPPYQGAYWVEPYY